MFIFVIKPLRTKTLNDYISNDEYKLPYENNALISLTKICVIENNETEKMIRYSATRSDSTVSTLIPTGVNTGICQYSPAIARIYESQATQIKLLALFDIFVFPSIDMLKRFFGSMIIGIYGEEADDNSGVQSFKEYKHAKAVHLRMNHEIFTKPFGLDICAFLTKCMSIIESEFDDVLRFISNDVITATEDRLLIELHSMCHQILVNGLSDEMLRSSIFSMCVNRFLNDRVYGKDEDVELYQQYFLVNVLHHAYDHVSIKYFDILNGISQGKSSQIEQLISIGRNTSGLFLLWICFRRWMVSIPRIEYSSEEAEVISMFIREFINSDGTLAFQSKLHQDQIPVAAIQSDDSNLEKKDEKVKDEHDGNKINAIKRKLFEHTSEHLQTSDSTAYCSFNPEEVAIHDDDDQEGSGPFKFNFQRNDSIHSSTLTIPDANTTEGDQLVKIVGDQIQARVIPLPKRYSSVLAMMKQGRAPYPENKKVNDWFELVENDQCHKGDHVQTQLTCLTRVESESLKVIAENVYGFGPKFKWMCSALSDGVKLMRTHICGRLTRKLDAIIYFVCWWGEKIDTEIDSTGWRYSIYEGAGGAKFIVSESVTMNSLVRNAPSIEEYNALVMELFDIDALMYQYVYIGEKIVGLQLV